MTGGSGWRPGTHVAYVVLVSSGFISLLATFLFLLSPSLQLCAAVYGGSSHQYIIHWITESNTEVRAQLTATRCFITPQSSMEQFSQFKLPFARSSIVDRTREGNALPARSSLPRKHKLHLSIKLLDIVRPHAPRILTNY